MEAFKSYVICTSPRSGSTLLCRLLREAGNAGFPESHFHAPSVEEWLGYYDLEARAFSTRKDMLRAILSSAHAHGKGATDIFGLRMQRHSFDYFSEQLRILFPELLNDVSRLEAAFGKALFVHLRRENKLDQAISFVKAEQSGLWHMAPDGTELERLSEPKDPVYDREAITAQLALAEAVDEAWESWFETERIKPFCITCDELSAAPYASLARMLSALGLECPRLDEKMPPVAKLADATNREWAERFLSEAHK